MHENMNVYKQYIKSHIFFLNTKCYMEKCVLVTVKKLESMEVFTPYKN